MPVVDISFLNPNLKRTGGSGGYNVLVDQLSILEKQLEVDGKLSPGDYDNLLGQARKLMGAPGLSTDQRSNIAVKIATYQKNRSTDGIKDTEDIDRLNRDVQDSVRQSTTLLADRPSLLLQANADALHAKITRLADSINRIDGAGDDSSKHLMEYNTAVNDLRDTLEALQDSQSYKAGSGKPASEFVAYMVTNNKGEISDVQFGRVGKSGYQATNALYGGMQVYGKVNAKENGNNIFLLGGKRYMGVDSLIPGPDGTFKGSALFAEGSVKGKQQTFVAGTPYVDVSDIKSQSTIDPGGWAQGSNGALYQRQQDGSYKKYVNVKENQFETLGITSNNLLKIPRVLEQGITSGVRETVDAAGGIMLPPPGTVSAPISGPTQVGPSAPALSPSPTPTGTPRTPAPTDRAPQESKGIAARAYSSAKSFLGGIFGR